MESEPGDRIRSPIKLADHVDPDEGPDLDSILADAERAINALKEDFLEQATTDLQQLKNAHASLPSFGVISSGDALRRIFEISHELQGLAGSFDSPLLTSIGTDLCDFISELNELTPLRCQVIGLHIAGMAEILHVSGDGGTSEKELVVGLAVARQKAISEPGARTDVTDAS